MATNMTSSGGIGQEGRRGEERRGEARRVELRRGEVHRTLRDLSCVVCVVGGLFVLDAGEVARGDLDARGILAVRVDVDR